MGCGASKSDNTVVPTTTVLGSSDSKKNATSFKQLPPAANNYEAELNSKTSPETKILKEMMDEELLLLDSKNLQRLCMGKNKGKVIAALKVLSINEFAMRASSLIGKKKKKESWVFGFDEKLYIPSIHPSFSLPLPSPTTLLFFIS